MQEAQKSDNFVGESPLPKLPLEKFQSGSSLGLGRNCRRLEKGDRYRSCMFASDAATTSVASTQSDSVCGSLDVLVSILSKQCVAGLARIQFIPSRLTKYPIVLQKTSYKWGYLIMTGVV